jgi:hypothetical protein
MAKAQKDYTIYINTKHGNLLIKEIVRVGRGIAANCLCDCGNMTNHTDFYRLINGKITSCKTCSNKINGAKGNVSAAKNSKYNNLIGKKVFYFTVLRRANADEEGGTFVCQCICGNIRYIDGYDLTVSKNRKSCGCQQSRLLSLSQGGNGIAHDGESLNEVVRKSDAYENWRSACLEKANYICSVSGNRGKRLNVHHILPLSMLFSFYGITKHNYLKFLPVIYNVENGLVLSEELHKELHKRYGKEVSLSQIMEFKNDYLKSMV